MVDDAGCTVISRRDADDAVEMSLDSFNGLMETVHLLKSSAKLVTWLLGILFFQGGIMSTVLVGTTVRTLADKAGLKSNLHRMF